MLLKAGGGQTKEVSNITFALSIVGTFAIFWSGWNMSTNFPLGGNVVFPKGEFFIEQPEGSCWFFLAFTNDSLGYLTVFVFFLAARSDTFFQQPSFIITKVFVKFCNLD